jgi:hypothetical protein
MIGDDFTVGICPAASESAAKLIMSMFAQDTLAAAAELTWEVSGITCGSCGRMVDWNPRGCPRDVPKL